MEIRRCDWQSYVGSVQSAALREMLSPLHGTACVVVDDDAATLKGLAFDGVMPACPVISVEEQSAAAPWADFVVKRAALDDLCGMIVARANVAAVLVQLTRHNERASVIDGLFAESLAYSALQHGEVFCDWLQGRTRKPIIADESPTVLVSREGDELHITLNRPQRRNAYAAVMRDAMSEALDVLEGDISLERAVIRGRGKAFCAGGDLDEFGQARDAMAAHLVRMTRSVAMRMHRLRDRIECRVHGACMGAGIELPAYARTIVAHPEAFFALPEVSFGLVPGAGGTVSILKRIGRHRFNRMALTGERVDALTALKWGLIDHIDPDYVAP